MCECVRACSHRSCCPRLAFWLSLRVEPPPHATPGRRGLVRDPLLGMLELTDEAQRQAQWWSASHATKLPQVGERASLGVL